MNIHNFNTAKTLFEEQLEKTRKDLKHLYTTRDRFCNFFSMKKIANMDIDEFVSGKGVPSVGFNFCYTLERELDELGRILGSTAIKFGIYFGTTSTDSKRMYRFSNKHKVGNGTYQEAFADVKQSILDLLVEGKNEDLPAIVRNKISPMFKGKILNVFYPERYLNVFAPDDLNHFIRHFNIDEQDICSKDAVYRRERLLEYKNSDPVMKEWSIDEFTHFLYHYYPRSQRHKNDTMAIHESLQDYVEPVFPKKQKVEFIDLAIIPLANSKQKTKTKEILGCCLGVKKDYEKEARIYKSLGEQGEKLVKQLEIQRLRNAGRFDLADKIVIVADQSDKYGYDILSFDEDGTERHIEVKATKAKVGTANFFLTSFELSTAMSINNYYIYIVYDVLSETPKVWAIANPFTMDNGLIQIMPINYKVIINCK